MRKVLILIVPVIVIVALIAGRYVWLATPKTNAVVVYPSFTLSAYHKGGFYDYYHKACDTHCLTIPIISNITGVNATSFSYHASELLEFAGYSEIRDQGIDKDPSILSKYSKVIMLHNEYVTQKEYDAVTQHPNVTYLSPNALYALVKANYENNTITLLSGHSYEGKNNAFDWKYDNTDVEGNQCKAIVIRSIENGDRQLMCNPEVSIFEGDPSFLLSLLTSI